MTFPPQPYAQLPARPTSGMAVASLVLSIIGLVFGCCSFGLPSILAVILGHVAMKETKSGAKGGNGLAVAGLVMGYLIAGPAIALSIWMVVMGGIGVVTNAVHPMPTPTP